MASELFCSLLLWTLLYDFLFFDFPTTININVWTRSFHIPFLQTLSLFFSILLSWPTLFAKEKLADSFLGVQAAKEEEGEEDGEVPEFSHGVKHA